MRVVLANGCFDILHVGHVRHLKEARTMGDSLIVSLTMDAYVMKGPGRPVNNWLDRFLVLSALECVDSVVPAKNAIQAILEVRPSIFVKGIDYAGGDRFTEDVHAACRSVGAEIRYTTSPKMSATDIIRRSLAA